MKIIRAAIIILALTITTRAAPVTIEEFLTQDPVGTVTIIETQECCEDKAGMPWWPLLFAAAVPIAFIERDEQIDLVLPPATNPTPVIHEPVPEPSTFSLGLLALAGVFVWRKRRVTHGN